MSFTTKIKNEISEIEGTRSEAIAELSGIVRNNGSINNDTLYLTTENSIIATKIIKMFKNLYEVEIKKEVKENLNFSKKELYLLSLNENLDFILEDLGYMNNKKEYLDTPPNYIIGSNEEIRAYLRGTFLCIGSINDPKTSRYHMELLISKPNEAVFIQKLLNIFELNAKILTRDKGYMIYIKEAEKISDYLKILKANKAVLYFENVRIYHEQKNKANRLNNCEQANMDKIVSSATAQLDQIKLIKDNLGESLLDEKTKEALEYRLKYPESSLKELSEIITIETGKKITKSGLNHRFRKIKELAEKLKNN